MEVDWLYDWIFTLATFMRHSRRVYDNEKVIENMKVKQNIDPEWGTSFFIQLYESIQCWKIDGKNLANAAKLVKEHIQYLIE